MALASRVCPSSKSGIWHGFRLIPPRRDFLHIKDCVEVVWWLWCHDEANGLFNLGTGRARCWNDLAAALFLAMERPVGVDYVPMPEEIRDKYQYFTEARMDRLARTGAFDGSYSGSCRPPNRERSFSLGLCRSRALRSG